MFVFLGAVNGVLVVALGAFGAHGLKHRLSTEQLAIFDTAVQYHSAHALGLLCIGILAHWLPESGLIRWAGWSLVLGIILFSGSLYVLSVTGLKGLGVITPFGGFAFIVGWALLAVAALRQL